jgi:hypothetical protein
VRILAKAPFQVASGQRVTVRAPLTKVGRRLLRRRGRLRARVSIVSASPAGRAVTRARTVTLKRRAASRADLRS